MKNIHESNHPPDFSVVLGGPLYQLLMRLHLTTPALDQLKRRIIVITLFAWLPLLLLSIYDHKAWSGTGVPFLYDIATQVRFLIALPLLIASELIVHQQLRGKVAQFLDRGIITGKSVPKFKKIIDSATQLRNSVSMEILLLFFVFIGGHFIFDSLSVVEQMEQGAGSWLGLTNNESSHLNITGYWYVFVSRPIFQFIVYRWYFRIFIWARFLWQTSRLELNLLATHPDRACGLGFLSMITIPFGPLVIAHGVLLSGTIAAAIFFTHAKLPDYLLLIVSIVVFLAFILLGPMFFFTPKLMQAKRMAQRDYGVLASKYIEQFDQKWLRGGSSSEKSLIGSSDIQSLADLFNSFQVIQETRSVPFDRKTFLQLVLFTLLPVAPLLLTMIPFTELIKSVFEAIF